MPEPIEDGVLTIFVDGSMRSSPRRGGIGIRFVWVNDAGDEETWDHALPATMGATNNEMELEAPSEALKLAMSARAPFVLEDFRKIEIRTDSAYVYDNVPIAISTWSKTQWTKSGGGAVLNVSAWKNLLSLMRRLDREHRIRVEFEWKKGKKGVHAKAVDKLAKQSSNNPAFGRAKPSVVRRKLTDEKVDPGSVRIEGQVMDIRIIEAQYLPPPHRRSRYRYEVVDRKSPYFGRVDWVESRHEVKRGHTYRVRLNADQRNPRIEEVLEEIEEDLSPYVDALRTVGAPAPAAAITASLAERGLTNMSVDSVRRRLDRLVEEGLAAKTRATGPGRPYLYEAREPESTRRRDYGRTGWPLSAGTVGALEGCAHATSQSSIST